MATLEDASTQYNDMTGTAAIDWHDFTVHSFAEKCGIDTRRYFPLGIKLYLGDRGYSSVSFAAAEKSIVGETIDEIESYAKANNGTVPTVRLESGATVEDIRGFAKRFEIVLKSKSDRICHLEFDEQ